MKLFAKYWLTNRDPVPTVMRINQSQIFNKTLIVLFLARIHLKYLGLFSETFLRTSMRPSLSGSPATPRASSGSLTCPSGLGQTSRCVFISVQFFLQISFSGDRHLHLSLALRLRDPGSPLSAQALHHPVPAAQKRSKLLHNSIEKCEDVNFYFNLQGARWSLLSVSLQPPRAEAISAMRLLPMANFKSLSLNLFPGEMPHWAWTEHEQ